MACRPAIGIERVAAVVDLVAVAAAIEVRVLCHGAGDVAEAAEDLLGGGETIEIRVVEIRVAKAVAVVQLVAISPAIVICVIVEGVQAVDSDFGLVGDAVAIGVNRWRRLAGDEVGICRVLGADERGQGREGDSAEQERAEGARSGGPQGGARLDVRLAAWLWNGQIWNIPGAEAGLRWTGLRDG